jgi:hypothetical protein
MPGEQDFQSFVIKWANERIWPIDDFLEYEDRSYMTKLRAAELARLACDEGFRDALIEAAAHYGGIVQYVKTLYWNADANELKTIKYARD